MNIFPAIDLFGGKAVRLFKGDYNKMTVYGDHPEEIALKFKSAGAKYIHAVDLEGAKNGSTPNVKTIEKIVSSAALFTEVGGGIRDMQTIETYLSFGVNRVILGTAAVQDDKFLNDAVNKYAEKIAVGIDLKDGYVAIKGWTENSKYRYNEFFKKMERIGVKTVICTDISKDGVMQGTNLTLYKELKENYSIDIIASGGVSDIGDVYSLAKLGVYGAIIGKAYYTGAIDLKEAIKVAADVD